MVSFTLVPSEFTHISKVKFFSLGSYNPDIKLLFISKLFELISILFIFLELILIFDSFFLFKETSFFFTEFIFLFEFAFVHIFTLSSASS